MNNFLVRFDHGKGTIWPDENKNRGRQEIFQSDPHPADGQLKISKQQPQVRFEDDSNNRNYSDSSK